MSISQFRQSSIPQEAELLRSEVQSFLKSELTDYPLSDRAHSWMGFDAEFSRKLGAKGWLGMSLPIQYGGAEA